MSLTDKIAAVGIVLAFLIGIAILLIPPRTDRDVEQLAKESPEDLDQLSDAGHEQAMRDQLAEYRDVRATSRGGWPL